MKNRLLLITLSLSLLMGCSTSKVEYVCSTDATKLAGEYIPVKLTTDVSHLSKNQQKILPLLFEVSDIMDNIYWKQAWGNKEVLFEHIKDNNLRKLTTINYGPWNRLDGDNSFIVGIGNKSLGAEFYPKDMTKDEFDQLKDPNKTSHYTIIKRDSMNNLKVVPYHLAYKSELDKASSLLKQAATLAENPPFKAYLESIAQSLVDDNYYKSDMAWMDIKDSKLNFVVGPIERYEDQLYGYKNSFEAIVLVRDDSWSNKIDHIIQLLPQLQKALPVDETYKSEVPSLNSHLDVCDVVYCKGDGNGAGKTIALNLPNNPKVQQAKGSRRIYLKNCMKAKFDKIMVPISKELIVREQQQYVTFDAFFDNTLLLEIAHGLGMNHTVDGKHTVMEQLKEHYSVIELGKADIVGLFLINELDKVKALGENHDIKDNYVTIMAGIFRALRFGGANTHGKANMIRFNYFCKYGAFEKDMVTGKYHVDFDKMHDAMVNLSKIYLKLQGDGNYDKASAFIYDLAVIPADLEADLVKLETAGIPRDIVFEQGLDQLDL
ncbi:Zn-dependent hydrolase [Halosquirtibacter xylanolyticus]|uniref:dipeptidyl-peptidase 3 family protein n=1 Tax=Halosquirtibacter xylanolyticus TaxID=3374599 RepID=UPI0037496A16|nr:Zn-dependent hydrolase [Prolixibacteraceae bacterium]